MIGEAITSGGEDFNMSELSDNLRGVVDLDLLLALSILAFSFRSFNCKSLNRLFLNGISFFSMSSVE